MLVLCRVREDVSIWVIARWQFAQVINQRLQQRQHDAAAGLFCGEANFALLKIDSAPGQPSQITESLAEVKTEQDKAAPLFIVTARCKDAPDFRQRERPSLR